LTIVIFFAFLFQNSTYTPFNFLLTLMGLISSAAILYIVLYIVLLPLSWTPKLKLYMAALLFTLTDIGLIIDFFIYRLFHFHINAMVLNILTSPDALDSIQTGVMPVLIFLLVTAAIIYFQYHMIQRLKQYDEKSRRALNRSLNRYMMIPLFLIILTEKITFGFATLFSKKELISTFKVIPLYQPLTFNRIAAKYFGVKAEKQAKYSIRTKADLNYPLQTVTVDRTIPPFNIFIIASDAVKYSILNKDITPNIMHFAKDALVFEHHYSGGNSTRFGIFSLIYGLNATYWFSFLNANQKPVLFDVLRQKDYDISIISSTNTNWPEFRKTCYVDIQKDIHDKFEGVPWEKDALSTACFLNHIATSSQKRPLFTFIFLDAPHGYSYPPEENRYHAPEGEVNYLAVSKGSQELRDTLKQYKNAVHYNDKLFGTMIRALKEKGLYDNAMIIYTSDHGQEFFEQGNFGHNTAFSQGQIHVPLLIKLPSSLKNHKIGTQINASLTSHQDVVPSILSLLGVTNDPSVYSNGKNFFSNTFHRDYVFSANWTTNAIITPHTTSVFSNLPNKIFNNEVRETKTYTLIPNAKTNSKFILDTMNENKKFLK